MIFLGVGGGGGYGSFSTTASQLSKIQRNGSSRWCNHIVVSATAGQTCTWSISTNQSAGTPSTAFSAIYIPNCTNLTNTTSLISAADNTTRYTNNITADGVSLIANYAQGGTHHSGFNYIDNVQKYLYFSLNAFNMMIVIIKTGNNLTNNNITTISNGVDWGYGTISVYTLT